MTDPNAVPVNRHALIYSRDPRDLERIARYLPSNYHVALNTGMYKVAGDDRPGILIEGHDVAGWTLDDYVLPRLASGLMFGSEVFYCASCGSHDHNINDCPQEIPVYAVKVDGEEYHHVADDLTAVAKLVGDSDLSYGQCQNCGGFGTLYSTSEEPKGFEIRFDQPIPRAVCMGCGTGYPIVLKRSKEVVF